MLESYAVHAMFANVAQDENVVDDDRPTIADRSTIDVHLEIGDCGSKT